MKAVPPTPDFIDLGRKALVQAAIAIEQQDAAAAERWLKVARTAGIDLNAGASVEAKGETVTERRASRDRLMAVLSRRFARISAVLDDDTGAAPQLPLLRAGPAGEPQDTD